ncbi:MAG: replicative DNA helicase [Candidatus Doudnabacteria bacterium RIFCSPHIGHO2_01_FULL_43_23]|uniref:Replicative DNA helicase n=1 Tax=Candidatus Doudnabacteria bacterium RIFCSPHIGHO2_01_FULL_43_23 TaxID=1817822 RepID=A0A1F5NVL9_9BACT|nr:MAG: replicative DNA helicase [Candidatus Doudnabacteria bacterium RIFCSPHIGHO2_01_FULL_43_23]
MPENVIQNLQMRVPPQNIEAEQSVLGSLMLDKEAIVKIADTLIAEDFYEYRHGLIYLSILELYETHSSIDILTVSNRLEGKKKLEEIGGTSYLTQLVNSVPSATHIVHYAKIVQHKSTLRRLIHASNEINAMGFQEEETLEILLDRAEQKLFGVSQKYLKQNFISINEVLQETFERIDELHRDKGKLRGVATGYTGLDNLLGGFQKSDLVILAARPSMGKTALALNLARFMAVSLKVPVGIFSLEMSKDQLVDRLLATEAGVGLWKMRTGRLSDQGSDNDFERIGHAMGKLSEAPIFIDDSAAANIMEIRTKARRLKAEHDLGLVIVDYLQLMVGANQESRVQEVSDISRSLKALARELNVPVLALSQLSRRVEERRPQIPQLSDLRDSGSIEQDADVVIFIYREEVYRGKDSSKPNIAQLLIKKHRNGPTGEVELFFDYDTASFRNLDKSHVSPTTSGDEEIIVEEI